MSRVIAHGVDLIEISRIERSITDHGERFIERCFTKAEADYARSAKPPRDIERFAARFAAKEAVLKALGTGWADGIAWTDVEVLKMPAGQPMVEITGKAKSIADGLGISAFHLSLSHTGVHAIASVVACG
ncbi:MAG: holo-[acyl-carrier-protein] synthase [Phycisphaerales bacterium]